MVIQVFIKAEEREIYFTALKYYVFCFFLLIFPYIDTKYTSTSS